MLELIAEITTFMQGRGFNIIDGTLEEGDPELLKTEQMCEYYRKDFGYPVMVHVRKTDHNARSIMVKLEVGNVDMAERVNEDHFFFEAYRTLCTRHNLPF